MVKIKRVYEASDQGDGYRVLVDRVWPRGVSKDKARVDEWARDIAPSTDLRKWFAHSVERWPEFRRRYRNELSGKRTQLSALVSKADSETLTLVYSAKDTEHNQAVVLAEYLDQLAGR